MRIKIKISLMILMLTLVISIVNAAETTIKLTKSELESIGYDEDGNNIQGEDDWGTLIKQEEVDKACVSIKTTDGCECTCGGKATAETCMRTCNLNKKNNVYTISQCSIQGCKADEIDCEAKVDILKRQGYDDMYSCKCDCKSGAYATSCLSACNFINNKFSISDCTQIQCLKSSDVRDEKLICNKDCSGSYPICFVNNRVCVKQIKGYKCENNILYSADIFYNIEDKFVAYEHKTEVKNCGTNKEVCDTSQDWDTKELSCNGATEKGQKEAEECFLKIINPTGYMHKANKKDGEGVKTGNVIIIDWTNVNTRATYHQEYTITSDMGCLS